MARYPLISSSLTHKFLQNDALQEPSDLSIWISISLAPTLWPQQETNHKDKEKKHFHACSSAFVSQTAICCAHQKEEQQSWKATSAMLFLDSFLQVWQAAFQQDQQLSPSQEKALSQEIG